MNKAHFLWVDDEIDLLKPHIMDRAIGKKITDYLLKPVNPKQVLIAIKKIIDKRQLLAEAATDNYRDEFIQLNSEISDCRTAECWKNVYRRLVYWEIELERTANSMKEVVVSQKEEANI